ncbi:hypothetical protein WOLCODRAFT_29634 [Wolfiporia cocos MD-104 SS10]|uniref:Uncharacterized protein n=1 Tax=Wolfiporia cocos (strain MD-104) TaxID=742152 RepID=A0A2H3JDD2_WOLCO|nr:hypothetical protein WOLCODRAFT_29634 [Wolfiporia cocos MD-104 SS10]
MGLHSAPSCPIVWRCGQALTADANTEPTTRSHRERKEGRPIGAIEPSDLAGKPVNLLRTLALSRSTSTPATKAPLTSGGWREPEWSGQEVKIGCAFRVLAIPDIAADLAETTIIAHVFLEDPRYGYIISHKELFATCIQDGSCGKMLLGILLPKQSYEACSSICRWPRTCSLSKCNLAE